MATSIYGLQNATVKPAAAYATTTALPAHTTSGGFTVLTGAANGALPAFDGITPAAGDRLLVKDEFPGQANGLYNVTSVGSSSAPYILTRSPDMAQGYQVPGAMVLVEQGTISAGAIFCILSAGPFTLGTTPVNWTALTAAQGYVHKAGDTMTGDLVLPGTPSGTLGAVPRGYVDGGFAGVVVYASGWPARPSTPGVVLWVGPSQPTVGGSGAAASDVFVNTSGAGAALLNPMSAVGDTMYGGTAGAVTRLAGNTTATRKFLAQTGTGSASAAPAWATVAAADLTGLLTAYLQTTASVTPSATANTYGTQITLNADSGFTGFLVAAAALTVAGMGSETLTVQTTVTYSDNTTNTQNGLTSFTANGPYSMGSNTLASMLGAVDGKSVKSIGFQVKSSIGSSAASMTVTIIGLNLP